MVSVLRTLVPICVDGLTELLETVRQEKAVIEMDETLSAVDNDPAAKPRRKIDPIHHLASYLMRNNPAKVSKPIESVSAYADAVNEVVEDIESTQTTQDSEEQQPEE
jgi:hypothetical protein